MTHSEKLELSAGLKLSLDGSQNYTHQIIRNIGRGGLAYVCEVEEPNIKEHKAIKLFWPNPNNQGDKKAKDRFLREIKFLKKVSDSNIIKIEDIYGWLPYNCSQPLLKNGLWIATPEATAEESIPFFVMELCEQNLGDYKRENADLKIATVLEIMIQTIKGVYSIHVVPNKEENFNYHRDLSPQNILIKNRIPNIMIKIADFGSIHITPETVSQYVNYSQSGNPAFHLRYASPELMKSLDKKGALVDHRTDIYSLGAIFDELIEGTPYSDVFKNIINKMMSRNPSDRHGSLEEVLKEIQIIKTKNDEIPYSIKRSILHHFIDLPDDMIVEIATKLNLISEGDRDSLGKKETHQKFFLRADEMNLLPNLRAEIESRHPIVTSIKNPFNNGG